MQRLLEGGVVFILIECQWCGAYLRPSAQEELRYWYQNEP